MRLSLFTIIALCLVTASRCAEEEYEYEEEPVPAAPVTRAPTRTVGRSNLLAPRSRGLPGRKPTPSTSTTAKPVEEVYEDEGEVEEGVEEEQEEVVTTTTEAPKKLSSGVRPFRSNEDLLAALKRRRAQIGSSNSVRETAAAQAAEPTTQKPKSVSSNNSRSRGSSAQTADKPSRGRFSSRSKPAQEEVEEESQQEEVQVKPKGRRGYSARSYN